MYIFLVFSNLIVSYLIRNRKIILGYFILSYVLIIGLRYDVGRDYLNYEKIFIAGYDLEKGYNFLQNVIYIFNGEFHHLTMLISFLMVVPIVYFFKNNLKKIKDLRIGILLFLISDFTFSSMNLMRQALASSFCFLAVDFYFKKKYINFLVLFLIGSFFHKSVVVFLLLFFILNRIKIKKILSIIFLVCIFLLKNSFSYTNLLFKVINFIAIMYPGYTSTKLEGYIEYTKNNSSILNLGLVLLIGLYILLVSFSKNKYLEYYEKFMFISLIFRVFSTQNFIFNRVSLYFDLFMFLSALIFYLNSKKSINKKIIFSIIVFGFFISFIKSGYFSSDTQKNKYKSIYYESFRKYIE